MRMSGTAGIGGLGAVVVVVLGLFFGVDLTPLLSGGGGGGFATPQQTGPNQIDDQTEEFVSVVLADTEEVWTDIFADLGRRYDTPTLVLYEERTVSACGGASAAMGPFYCPGDERIFLDTGFFRTMQQRLGGGGDFAYAYVIAHEVAHHVQQELGILGEVNRLKSRAREVDANALSVRTELQADCFSGIWARKAEERYGVLEPGDIEEAMATAAAIGDDALARARGGAVVPDSFTHGTSAQRQRWFARGFERADVDACDTFGTDKL